MVYRAEYEVESGERIMEIVLALLLLITILQIMGVYKSLCLQELGQFLFMTFSLLVILYIDIKLIQLLVMS